ncbi:hypothetical protein [Prosthecobacter debontii]|uniref:hypothetical protein n=1 Tax=Prosthecobacter debontii TaxID=48467 RepID=UPI001590920C|nr:hypothetical protein [Prosthecobacter debontii]
MFDLDFEWKGCCAAGSESAIFTARRPKSGTRHGHSWAVALRARLHVFLTNVSNLATASASRF